MHVLMIAPEPFFEARGTPFSEFHRIKAMLSLGHTVDLVTYPFGREVEMPGLRIFRCVRPPFIRSVRIGPSLPKVPLDISLAFTALRRALSTRYDAVHSHEEGGLIGIALARLLGVPHLYDMHSSLPQQLDNFAFTNSRLLTSIVAWSERLMVRHSRVVVVICPQLEDVAREVDPNASLVLIENSPGSGEAPTAGTGQRIRESLGLAATTPMVLYTGTFEAYQGLDLLYAAAARARAHVPDMRVVLVGGKPEQVEEAKRQAQEAGAGHMVLFTGQRPADDIPAYLDAADVLVSPRSTGTNTPLKIYQYLRSGRPIVATRLLTHTQVLDDGVAVLCEPTPEAFAAGIVRALTDRTRSAQIARNARELADTKYSYEAYLNKTREALARLSGDAAVPLAGTAS